MARVVHVVPASRSLLEQVPLDPVGPIGLAGRDWRRMRTPQHPAQLTVAPCQAVAGCTGAAADQD